jgi:hypothetical protein
MSARRHSIKVRKNISGGEFAEVKLLFEKDGGLVDPENFVIRPCQMVRARVQLNLIEPTFITRIKIKV